MPEPVPPPPRRWRLSPRTRQTLSWLLAPILAVAAIALQISLDVPRGEMLEREAKKKPARKSAASRTKPKSKPKSRSKPSRSRWKPRSPEEIEALRAQWSDAAIDDEPSDLMFRRRHEATLRSVATRTRTALLEGEKLIPLQVRPSCKTIRCTLELCGPPDLLEDMAQTLPRVTVVDRPLWHEIREIEPTQMQGAQAGERERRCRRWLVDFAIQAPKTHDLVVPSE